MTREEEMKSVAEKESVIFYKFNSNCGDCYEGGFIDGAKWADETMIDKACEWLDKVNTDNYMDSGIFQISELINDLKKAMKGE